MNEQTKLPDIVERLRIVGRQKREDLHRRVTVISGDGDLYDEAADEITRLRSPAPAEDEEDMSESIRTYQKLLHEYIDTLAARDRQIKHLLEDGEGLREALEMSNRMAEDHGLWFAAETCAEAYLQQALRKLCDVIERAALSSGRKAEDGEGLREAPDIERIILRRLYEKRIEGYTLEMSQEIAALSSGRKAEDGEKLWLWRDGKDRFLAFRSLFPLMPDGGDPATIGQPSGYAFYHPMTLAEAQKVSREAERTV